MRKIKKVFTEALLKTKQFIMECRIVDLVLFLIIMLTVLTSILASSYQIIIMLAGIMVALLIVKMDKTRRVEVNEEDVWYIKDISLLWEFLLCYIKETKKKNILNNLFKYITSAIKKVEIKVVITLLLLVILVLLSRNIYILCISLGIMLLTLYLSKYVSKRKEEDEIWRMSELSLLTSYFSAIVRVIRKRVTSLKFWRGIRIKKIFICMKNKMVDILLSLKNMSRLDLMRRVAMCTLALGLFVSQIGITLAAIDNKTSDPQQVNVEEQNLEDGGNSLNDNISVVKQIRSFENFNENGFTAYQMIEKDKGTSESDLGMPSTMNVILSDGSEEKINVTWKCADDSFGNHVYDAENINAIYTYEVMLPEGYELVSDEVVLPWLNVTLKEISNQQLNSGNTKATTSTTVSTFNELQIAAANADITEIIVANNFDLTETIILNRNLSIKGIGATTTLKRATSSVLFQVSEYEVSLSTLIIDGNKENYPESEPILTVNNSGTLNLNDGTIVQNNMGSSTSSDTGVINTYDDAIESNHGTAILVFEGTAVMNDSATIKNNIKNNYYNGATSALGGAGFLIFEKGILTINNGEISENSVNDSGGGIASYGTVAMKNGVIKNNTVTKSIYGGAGIRLLAYQQNNNIVAGTFSMSGGTFSNNRVLAYQGRGGAIYNTTACQTSISGGLIDSSNTASEGGAIFHSAASNNQSGVIPLAKLSISGIAIINSPVYLYSGVYLNVSSKIEKPIIIQPMKYSEATTLIKGENYTLTEADARKIKVNANGSTSWYTKLNSSLNAVALSSTNTFAKDKIYVDGVKGNDESGDGTETKPLKTLEEALGYVAPGGSIIIDDTVTIDKQIVIEAPENVYGVDGVTIKSSETCKEASSVCKNGVIVISHGGELIFGPITIDVPILVEEGGTLTISDQTKIHTTITGQPQDLYIGKDTTGNSLSVSVKNIDNYTFSYQWYSNISDTTSGGSKITGATNSSYEVPTTSKGVTYYYCIITANNSSAADEYTLTSETAKVSVVTKPQVNKTDETILGWNDGTITGLDDSMEYMKSSDNSYTTVAEGTTEVTNLASGTYYVRYQGETNDNFRTEVIISEGDEYTFSASLDEIVSFETVYGNTNATTNATKNIGINNNSNEFVTIQSVEVTGTDFSIVNDTSINERIEKGKSSNKYKIALNAGLSKGTYSTRLTVTLVGNGTEHKITKEISAVVNAKEVTIGAQTGKTITKVYDGTDGATVAITDFTINGVLENDVVSLDLTDVSAIYNSTDVSSASTVKASKVKLTGANANNYRLKSDEVTFVGEITPMEITFIWKTKTEYEWTGEAQYITPITFIDENRTEQDVPYKITKDGKKVDFKDGGIYEFSFAEDEWETEYGENFNNYSISKDSIRSKEYTIEYYELTKDMVSGIEDVYTHSGQTIRPNPIVTMDEKLLISNTDYKVTYDAPVYTSAGDYTITITGKGKYVGTLVFNYKVEYAEFEGNPLVNVKAGEGGYFSRNIRLDPNTLKNGYYGSLTPNGTTYSLSVEGSNNEIMLYFTKGNSQPIYWKKVIYSLDKTDPNITGIESEKTYYVNQKAIIDDANPYQFILNEKTVGDIEAVKVIGNEYIIVVGDKAETLKLRAVDKADNSTNYYELKLQPLSSILNSDLELANVKSTDKSAIDKAIKVYNSIDVTYATDKQKEELTNLKKYANELLTKIESVKTELSAIETIANIEVTQVKNSDKLTETKDNVVTILASSNLTDLEKLSVIESGKKIDILIKYVKDMNDSIAKVNNDVNLLNKNNVTSDDSTELEQMKKDLNTMVNDTYKDNLLKTEKDQLEEMVTKVTDCLDRIDEVKKDMKDVEDYLASLTIENVKSDKKEDLNKKIELVDGLLVGNNLTSAESLKVKDLKEETNNLLDKINEVEEAINSINKGNEKLIDKVTLDDKKDISSIKNKIEVLINGDNLVDNEKQEIQNVKTEVEAKLDRIEKVQEALNKLNDVKEKNKDTVVKEDQSVLDSVNKVIDSLGESFKDNTTETEKENIADIKKHVDEIQKILDEVVSLENEFNNISIKDEYLGQEEQWINQLLDRIDKLSDHQNSIFDKEVMKKVSTIRSVVRKNSVKEDNHGIKVEGINNTDFELDTTLSVEVITGAVNSGGITLSANQEIKEVYDIKLLLDGKVIQPNGKVRVSIPLSKEQMEWRNIKIYYIMDDGSTIEIPCELIGNMLVFEVDHFSYYAVVGDIVPSTVVKNNGVNSKDTTNANAYLFLLVSSAFVLLRSKKKEV